jgi:4-amino-4-deoxy-L-arabinose transferase-like glycosyltransferase
VRYPLASRREPPDRIAWVLAAAVFVLRLPLANRYDVFRDELYFIVCGRRPAFGYVDQPPLVPLLSAAFFALGHQTWLLRLPAVLAAAALVWLTVRFARLLGGGDGAAWAAGITAAVAPMFLGMFATFNTTVFEPLAWTAIAYALARAALLDDRRALVWAGLVAGIALEAKYALPAWLVALCAGLLLTPERRLLARRELWIGLALAAVVALPSIAWQAANHWPFAELVRAAGDKNTVVPPLAFAANQVLVMNPLFAPLWIAGIAAPFAWRDLARTRFVAIAFVVVAAIVVASHGKDYYLAAAYPPLFALGAVAFERVVRSAIARGVYLAAAVAVSAVVAPTALPILPPSAVAAYMQAIHLAPDRQEKSFAGTALPQEFADQLGWHDYVAQLAAAYDGLPPDVRARTALVVQDYGEAGALDVYGPAYGLPPALSGHNTYFLWGQRGQHPDDIIRPTQHPELWRKQCATTRILGKTFSPYAMAYENGKSILLCTHLHPALAQFWPELKNYN